MTTLSLKVDIDTYRGFHEGLPSLLRILGDRKLKASFFVTFGPDRSGLALIQLLRPAFLRKMLRTNAAGTYGLATAFYGTLLPAPIIAADRPEVVKNLAELGHEVACHAWDHRLWQDWLKWLPAKNIHTWFARMVDAYETALDSAPGSFGAPGWCMDHRALKEAAAWNFKYLSCTRAEKPFIFAENGLLEIPSNLPCIEEAGLNGVLSALSANAQSPVPQVLPVHTEVEGNNHQDDFCQILEHAMALGYRITTLADVAAQIDRTALDTRELKLKTLQGRAFPCAV